MAKCCKVKDIPNPNFDQTADVFKWKNWKTFFKKKNLSHFIYNKTIVCS